VNAKAKFGLPSCYRGTIAEYICFGGEWVRQHNPAGSSILTMMDSTTGASQGNLDPNIKPLNLTGQDIGGYCRLLEEPNWQDSGNIFPLLSTR
jgi:hypothetical protein